MKRIKFLSTLLSLTAMLFLSLLTTTNAQAQTFSGQAVGVQSKTTETATVAGVATTTVLANVRVADTGPLPPAGGVLGTGLVAAQAAINTGVANATFSTGILTSTTSGGKVRGVPTSTSQSTVNNVNLDINGVTVTATTIQANSKCTCAGTTPTCSGNVMLTNLMINGQLVTVDANGSIPANTTLLSTDVTVSVDTLLTTTTTRTQTSIIGNEQIPSSTPPGTTGITVNALHIRTTTTVTVLDKILGTTTTTTTTSDIIIAQAHSDINCNVATAAPVSISGRVISPFGRGVASARIVLTNSIGERRMAMTNPSGYFSFKEIGSGETYIVEIKHKSYYFMSQVLSVTNDLTELNFTALPFGKSGGNSRSIPAN